MGYKVHLAFGFHVNCYHSYRGDTPDALGFGGDIRIMRHILDTLDDRNAKGIPVRGTWDFENAYSLEKILPEYAPDIIERVKNRGDENILMGYNNGAMSAMTDDEFETSVNWAVTNPYGSGLKDIFGSCEMIIRPQEVMFTPAQVKLYNKLDVKAVCLYYSCISFDAFRTLIPQLPDEQAFNPLKYTYKGDSITVIPIYSPNDIMDAGSLRALCTELHYKQVTGEITRDVLIFINTDADSFLWEPMAVPKPMRKLPCFGGIGGYIDEVADLDFVVFNTPGGYLRNHETAGELSFSEDVADGNLSGYMSWSEKPFNRLIWTRLEKARAYSRFYPKDSASPSFETRVRLLSTTHFGLASPVMNITREEKALALSEKMLSDERNSAPAKEKLTLIFPRKSDTATCQLSVADGFLSDISALRLEAAGIGSWSAVAMSRYESGYISSVCLFIIFTDKRLEAELDFSVSEAKEPKTGILVAGDLKLDLKALPYPALSVGGKKLAELHSFINYGGERYYFGRPTVEPMMLAGDGAGERMRGEIHLPGELEAGSYTFEFFTVPGFDCVFVRSQVRYPYTLEDHEISSQASNLGRFSDTKWLETAPFELTVKTDSGAKVQKRSFAGEISEYPISDFWNAFPENRNISSFNHQLTGGTLTLSGESGGVMIAHMRSVLGSMAHCPMRLRSEGESRIVSMNPFGTYFGPQRYYPTRGNGSSMDLYLAAAPQARSLAPAYNGAEEISVQAIFGITDEAPTESQQRAAEDIADGCVAIGGDKIYPFYGDNVSLHKAVGNKLDPRDLKSVTFVEQIGGVMPLADLVKRYFANQRKAQKRMKKLLKLMEGKDA